MTIRPIIFPTINAIKKILIASFLLIGTFVFYMLNKSKATGILKSYPHGKDFFIQLLFEFLIGYNFYLVHLIYYLDLKIHLGQQLVFIHVDKVDTRKKQ